MLLRNYDNKTINVALFAVVLGFLGLFGSDLYLPAMPVMKIVFNSSVASIEFSIAIYLIGFGLSPLVFGPLADRFGRKKVVVFGLSLALIGAAIAGLSNHINTFLLARLIQGFGAGATLSMFRIMLRDVVQGKEMAVLASYTTMAFNLSPVLGMVIGGYLVHFFNWRVCFLVLVLSYLVFIVVYILYCPETLKKITPLNTKSILSNYIAVLHNKQLIGCAICSGVAFSVIFAFATAGSFIFQHELNVSAVVFGWLGLALSLASIIGKQFNAKLANKFPLQQLMLIGMILIAIGGLCLLLMTTHSVIGTLLMICLASGSTALILSNAMAIGMHSYTKGIGYAASIYGSIQLLTVFITNGILSRFSHFGILSLSIFFLCMAFIAICVKFFMIGRPQYDSQ